MITKTTSKKRVWCSSLALIPVFIAAIFIFSTKTIAQHDMNVPLEQTGLNIEMPVQDNPPKVTPDLPQDSKLADLLKDSVFAARYEEFNQIVESQTIRSNGKKYIRAQNLTKEEMERLQALFQSMTPEQQSVMEHNPQRKPPLEARIPTKEQYDSWKDPAQYGVWIDDRRIENSELDRYQPSDFSYYTVSGLTRTAKDYGKYVYQLDLHTTANFKKWKAEWDADERIYLMPNSQICKMQ